MRILIILIFLISNIGFSQNFKYDIEGLNPEYVVVEIDSLNQNELYLKSINWIKETYVNPDEVINTTIENEKIRFTGSKPDGICTTNKKGDKAVYCFDTRYMIEIAFKDGRYKFTPIRLEYWLESVPQAGQKAGWKSLDFSDGSFLFNKKGEIPLKYAKWPIYIESIFNVANESLKLYLSNNHSAKDEKW